jgi:hypothetical protein
MNLIPDPSDQSAAELERRVHGLLRALPERSAPASLENRVRAEIGRRPALPWWRRSYAFWPAMARSAFIFAAVASAGSVAAALFSAGRSAQGASVLAVITAHFTKLEVLGSIAADAREMVDVVLGAIPPIWLYGSLAVFAAGSSVLAGIGAVAYRIYSSRSEP